MPASVGVGGTWKTVNKIFVGVGGAWKTVSKGWVGVGGVWKEFYTNLFFPSTQIEVFGFALTPGTATASASFLANGTYTTTGFDNGNWVEPTTTGIGSSYQILFTTTSGTLSSGTTGVWLSFPQTISVTRSFVGSSEWRGTAQIRDTATNTVQVTRNIVLTADVEN